MNANDFKSALPLSALPIGISATITDIHTDDALRQRLQALGFRTGKTLQVMRRANFSGPLQVRIGTTDILLRSQEANKIEVKPI